MYPLLQEGELVFLKELEEVEMHGIVVYSANGDFIIHRVVALSGDMVMTRGDNAYACDPPIHREQVLAQVQYKLSQGQKVPLKNMAHFGRCREDGRENPDRVFRYLTNQFLKGLDGLAYWVSSADKKVSIQKARLVLEKGYCQQLETKNARGWSYFLFMNINCILKHLAVLDQRGEPIIAVGLKCSSFLHSP